MQVTADTARKSKGGQAVWPQIAAQKYVILHLLPLQHDST